MSPLVVIILGNIVATAQVYIGNIPIINVGVAYVL